MLKAQTDKGSDGGNDAYSAYQGLASTLRAEAGEDKDSKNANIEESKGDDKDNQTVKVDAQSIVD